MAWGHDGVQSREGGVELVVAMLMSMEGDVVVLCRGKASGRNSAPTKKDSKKPLPLQHLFPTSIPVEQHGLHESTARSRGFEIYGLNYHHPDSSVADNSASGRSAG